MALLTGGNNLSLVLGCTVADLFGNATRRLHDPAGGGRVAGMDGLPNIKSTLSRRQDRGDLDPPVANDWVCIHCGVHFEPDDALAGRSLACPKCGEAVRTPDPKSVTPDPKPEPPDLEPPKFVPVEDDREVDRSVGRASGRSTWRPGRTPPAPIMPERPAGDPVIRLLLSIRRTLRAILVFLAVGIMSVIAIADPEAAAEIGCPMSFVFLIVLAVWLFHTGDISADKTPDD
ncbi:MAG: hypothetical protein GY838_03875 [bacterium]|nr:hypothetical protein [bacterium]